MFNFPDLVAARAAAKKAKRTKKAAPSPDGDNGPPAPPEPEPPQKAPRPGRTADGKFAPGNCGGPGNPFARQVASFRQALYEAVTRDMLKDLATRLWGMALGGNVAAARLLLQYLVGKPQDPPNPDRLEHDEWQTYQSEAVPPADMTRLLGSMPATMANGWADGIWPVMADCNIRRPMLDRLRADREQREAQAHAAEAETAVQPRQDAPTVNGDNGRYAAPQQPATPQAAAALLITPAQPQPVPAARAQLAGRQQTTPSAATRQRNRPAPRTQPPSQPSGGTVSEPANGPVPRGGGAGAPSANGGRGAAAGPPERRRVPDGGRPEAAGGAGAPSANGNDG
jgi:hypothetical protein